jgi:SAM-dependent methyltransferase
MTGAGENDIYRQDWEQERARLAGLSAQFDAITIRHLSAIGVAAGWHCLEVGAGAGSVARWLAGTVGTTGRVVASDLDGAPEQDAFDLVHTRAVLEHVPGRGEVASRLAKALRPGGVLVLEDVVFGGAFAPVAERFVGPPAKAPAFTLLMGAVAAGFRAIGADPEYGLNLPATLAGAGLRDVNAELACRLVHGGSAESVFYDLSLQELHPRLIAAGLLTSDDVAEMTAFIRDPEARWLSLGLVTAWGWRT